MYSHISISDDFSPVLDSLCLPLLTESLNDMSKYAFLHAHNVDPWWQFIGTTVYGTLGHLWQLYSTVLGHSTVLMSVPQGQILPFPSGTMGLYIK